MEIPLGGFHVKTQFINRFYLFTLNWKAKVPKEHEKNATLPFGESFLLGESIDPQMGGEKTRTRQMYGTTSKQVFCWSHVFVRGCTIVSNSLFVFFQGENRMYHYLREKIQWTKKPGSIYPPQDGTFRKLWRSRLPGTGHWIPWPWKASGDETPHPTGLY